MAKHYYLVLLAAFITANLHAQEELPSVELIEFLADWEQEDELWFDTETSTANPSVTTEQEADHESKK